MPLCGAERDGAVPFGNLFDWTVSKKTDAAALANRGQAGEIFEGVEGRLAGIPQHVAVLTSLK